MTSPTEISVAQLSRLIGTHSAPTIIDVRIDEDFELDPDYIPTATRCSHNDISSLVEPLRDKQVVVYCQKAKKLARAVLLFYAATASWPNRWRAGISPGVTQVWRWFLQPKSRRAIAPEKVSG